MAFLGDVFYSLCFGSTPCYVCVVAQVLGSLVLPLSKNIKQRST